MPRRAPDVREDGHDVSARELLPQRAREPEQRPLGLVQEDQLAHAEPRQASAELGADRSPGAGDEDGGVREVPAELVAELDDRPAEQHLVRDVLEPHATVP